MRIKWERIIGHFLSVIFVYLFFKIQPFLGNLLEVVNQDYGYETPIKSIMLGVLCLSFLCAIKLLLTKN